MSCIAFFEIEEWEEEHIKSQLPNHKLLFFKDKLIDQTIEQAKEAAVVSTFIYSTLQKNVIEALPNLRFIATRSTGFDHIDVGFCKEKQIQVANVPTYGAHTVAEHTFALILALSRKLIPSVERSKQGDFSLDGLTGFDLFGKTIGVIGSGNIGRKVIEIAHGFGMKVLVYNRHSESELANDWTSLVSLEYLLSNSDIITLHLPHTPETHHIINMNNIQIFKKGSLLINTSRGPLVETQAVLEGLNKKILSGAGLDVLEEECNMKEERELLTSDFLKTCDIKTQLLNHVLLTRSDVVITPHNAFNSNEALKQILETSLSNIQAFLNGSPQNLVS